VKYASLASTHCFVPIAIETDGVFGREAITFFDELGRRLRQETGEPASRHYLVQRLLPYKGVMPLPFWDPWFEGSPRPQTP